MFKEKVSKDPVLKYFRAKHIFKITKQKTVLLIKPFKKDLQNVSNSKYKNVSL